MTPQPDFVQVHWLAPVYSEALSPVRRWTIPLALAESASARLSALASGLELVSVQGQAPELA